MDDPRSSQIKKNGTDKRAYILFVCKDLVAYIEEDDNELGR